jgi:hypothetical protein
MVGIVLQNDVRHFVAAADVGQNAVVDEGEVALVSVAEALATEMPSGRCALGSAERRWVRSGRQFWLMVGMSTCEEPRGCALGAWFAIK